MYSKNFNENRKEIDELINDLLLRGESQSAIRKAFGSSWTALGHRAKSLGVTRRRPNSAESLADRMRKAIQKELKPGEPLWSQGEARLKFKCGTQALSAAKKILADEGLIEQINPKVLNRGFRRVK